MTPMKMMCSVILAMLAASSLTTPIAAQQPALGGPAIPGVCLLSREAVFANAAVGKAASARIAELTRAAQAEIDQLRGPLETEATAIAALGQDAKAKARRDALATRWQALQSQAAHGSREIDATRAKALARVADEAQPVIAKIYAAHKCGLLFDRGAALGGNFSNDLTADVVTALDAKITTFGIERERLPQLPDNAAPRGAAS
ncbi:Skp family chaperone for outer membrane proteins [Sphingopyxis panaciterrae]|uniref:OmpH family outer membrane protein n=1 Tax=Sphingopyxis panaciterrae TaxID=363841 RepID=UPI001423397D|nr:OmpH family outer membrane protein [Sphingopyxis panaciterrae]NIJ39294.1 Skp family chaperone for outer membrane proteins [Sphingopyxis panaciterrae]